MIITIDGPAGTGKSSVAKQLARALHFIYFDTGAMYRSFSWFLQKKNISPSDEQAIEQALKDFSFDIQEKNSEKVYLVNGQDVSEAIRSSAVTSIVSTVAAYSFVRKEMVKIQRQFAIAKNAVFEGRDMGTVVFPNADLKVFLTADAEIRAERRYKELLERFPNKEKEISLNQILEEIQYRDHHDSTRKISPLKKAQDAHEIDTSKLNIKDVVDKILDFTKKQVKPSKSYFYCFIRFLAKTTLRVLFGLKVYGKENVPKGSALIASNHVSFLDPSVIAAACPYEINFLAKASLFKHRLFGWFIRKLHSHPISPNIGDRRTFKITFDLLKNSQKVLIFPEGQRSKTEEISPIKSGIAFLALKSMAPIVPTYIAGTYKAWPRNQKFPKPFVRITCIFGPPIYVHEWKNLPRDEAIAILTKKTEESIKLLQRKFET